MTPGELKFALEVETALNTIPQVTISSSNCAEAEEIIKIIIYFIASNSLNIVNLSSRR